MKRPSTGGVLRGLVAVLLTGYIVWRSGPVAILRAAAGVDALPILGAVVLVLADRTLMALRWIVLLRPLSPALRPPLRVLLRIFFLSTFVGTFLPASVGGDAVRAYALTREQVPGAPALASVLMDRVLGVLSLLLVALVGLCLARDLLADVLVLGALALTAAVCLVSALLVFSQAAGEFGRRLFERLPWAAVRRVGQRLLSAVRQYAAHRRDLAIVLAGSIGVQLLRIVQAYLLGRGLRIDAGLEVYVAFIPVILLVMLLPVTINGLGTSQAAFVWLFGRTGVPTSLAVALSILFVALGVVGNLPGGILYATGGAQRDSSSALSRKL